MISVTLWWNLLWPVIPRNKYFNVQWVGGQKDPLDGGVAALLNCVHVRRRDLMSGLDKCDEIDSHSSKGSAGRLLEVIWLKDMQDALV